MIRLKARLSNKKNRNNESPLIFDINYQKKRIYISSGLVLNRNVWNHDKQEIRKSIEINASLLNAELKKKKQYIEEGLEKLIKLEIPITKENIFLYTTANSEKKNNSSFFTIFNEFIETKASSLATSTKQKYYYLQKALMSFSEKYNISISFKIINQNFFNQFEEYFLKERNVYNNGFGGYVKNLKTFLKWATEKNYNTNLDFKKFEVYKEDADIFPLTKKEISIIENGIFQGLKDEIKDVFLFQVYTGLRISDTQRLRVQHIDLIKEQIKKFRTKKTGEEIYIPLTKKSISILNKYKNLHNKGLVLPSLNTQTVNKYLKIIADELGLHNEVIYFRKKGREYEEFKARRCDIISSHDGRRTFITQCLTRGMNHQMIMVITGHRNYKTFERYIKFDESDIKTQLQLIWN